MRYLGVDLHSNNFTVCWLTEDGRQTFEKYKLCELLAFKQCLQADDRIAVEATGNTRFFYNQVAPLVAECVIVNPSQFEIIKQSVSKTDRHDARALAQFLSKALLPTSRMKEQLHAQVNSLASTRDKLVKLRTTLLNKIHAHLTAHGFESRKEAYDHEANLVKVLRMPLPPLVLVQCTLTAKRYSPYLSPDILSRSRCSSASSRTKEEEARNWLIGSSGLGNSMTHDALENIQWSDVEHRIGMEEM